ncbi:MAG TPA: hypothetical protein VGN95_01575 [Pyrinomonadaceae bacterium]|jgi:hypothetical protein|nr:hypothetical protein [Pyrinomonadaceae bacterium]
MKQTKPVAVSPEAQMDLVSMDLCIEVLEHRTVLIAAAGACTSSSSSCSNIHISLLDLAL